MTPVDPSHAPGSQTNAKEATTREPSVEQMKLENHALKRALPFGLAAALVYGLVARLTFGFGDSASMFGRQSSPWYATFSIMSVAFLYGVPFAMGFVVVYLGRIQKWWRAIWFPQIAALASLALALLFALEGLICIAFWLPAYIALTAVGGSIACLIVRRKKNREAFLGIVLVLPYGLAFLEHEVPAENQLRQVETYIDIAAPVDAVWEQIVDVPLIEEAEHGFAWSHVIGFPRPVSARTSERALGAVREAKFERGVVFHERVTRYEPNHALEFDIKADSRTIPRSALDEHVTLGGPYFDVLHGAYRIEPLSNGVVRLHLSSNHRLTTHFNGYAAQWTDFIMRDTQNYILTIVARRATGKAP